MINQFSSETVKTSAVFLETGELPIEEKKKKHFIEVDVPFCRGQLYHACILANSKFLSTVMANWKMECTINQHGLKTENGCGVHRNRVFKHFILRCE